MIYVALGGWGYDSEKRGEFVLEGLEESKEGEAGN